MSHKLEHSDWKKSLGFRHMQEKLENIFTLIMNYRCKIEYKYSNKEQTIGKLFVQMSSPALK